MDVGPAPLLSAIVGVANAAIFVLLFGSARARLVLLFPAAILGAHAGQAIGARLTDPLRIGDFALLWASGFAWLGILIVVLVSQLGPARRGPSR
ncbi:MAG: hypothetical protein ACXWOW_05645 [Candidatus Limnocylindrales bacterium]